MAITFLGDVVVYATIHEFPDNLITLPSRLDGRAPVPAVSRFHLIAFLRTGQQAGAMARSAAGVAKEIEVLIGDSVEKVESGAKLAHSAGVRSDNLSFLRRNAESIGWRINSLSPVESWISCYQGR